MKDSTLRVARRWLIGLSAAALAVLCVRAFVGAVSFGPISIRSPLSLEEFIAAAWIVLILSADGSSLSREEGKLQRPWLALGAVLVAVTLVFFWNLRDPFLSDDYILVSRASLDPRTILSYFLHPGGDGSYRPIGYLYHGLVGHWAGQQPWKWHVSGLILHLLNCTLLFLLTGALWSDRFLALISAIVFGIHGTRPEVVTWTAGNFDSLAVLFVLAALLCVFHKRGERPSPILLALMTVFLVLGVWSKESAYAMPILLVGFAVAAGGLKNRRVLWSAACAVLTCSILFAYRWYLFGGPGGYADPVTGQPAILSLNIVSALKALLLRVWAILLFPLDWDGGHGAALAAGALLSGAILLYAAWNADRRSRSIFLAMILMTMGALLPVLHLALLGSSELGSRILYLPSIGFCILCARLATGGKSQMAKAGITAAIAMATLVPLIYNLRIWHRTAVRADQFCSELTASAGSPQHRKATGVLDGVFFFANGLPECQSMKRAAVPR